MSRFQVGDRVTNSLGWAGTIWLIKVERGDGDRFPSSDGCYYLVDWRERQESEALKHWSWTKQRETRYPPSVCGCITDELAPLSVTGSILSFLRLLPAAQERFAAWCDKKGIDVGQRSLEAILVALNEQLLESLHRSLERAWQKYIEEISE